jgi:glycosyltransferase involved in cell wall biosynthesis
MRLAVIETAPRGGLLHYAAQLSEALAERGNAVDLITARGHELESPPASVRMRDVLPAAVRDPSEPPAGWRYLVRRAGIAMRVVAASLRTLVEVVRGGYEAVLLIDDLSVAPAAAGAWLLTWVPGGPKIAAVCHEPLPRSRRDGDELYQGSGALSAILRRLYPRLELVLVHGAQSREQFEQAWPPSRVEVIPHGDERILAGDPPPPSDEERILFFGEWRRAKGLHVLMEAFDGLVEQRPQARLTVAGVPTADVRPDAVRSWAAGHDGRVRLVDEYVPMGDVRGLFAEARVVATPYIAGSQSGVLHLAMTMRRAVVASDVGELASTVVDGVTGRVVPAGDVTALRDALAAVLSDPALADEWGAAGRERVLSEFGWERVAERVESALELV